MKKISFDKGCPLWSQSCDFKLGGIMRTFQHDFHIFIKNKV